MSVSVSNIPELFRRVYPEKRLHYSMVESSPLAGLIRKKDNFGGEDLATVIKYSNGSKRSATLSVAQSRAAGLKAKKFVLTRVSDYAVIKLDNETIEASARLGDEAIAKALVEETDSALDELRRGFAMDLYRNRQGVLGTISSVSTTTVTLTNASDAMNFTTGQSIVAAIIASATSATVRTAATITNINVGTGVITFDVSVAGLSWTAADTLHVEGDISPTDTVKKVAGLGSYCPITAPTAGESFFGIDRSSYVELLAGWRIDGTARRIDEALKEGFTQVSRGGGKLSHVFMNPTQMNDLSNVIETRSVVDNAYGMPKIGYKGVEVVTGGMTAKAFSDWACPVGTVYGVNLEDLEFSSLGAVPRNLLEQHGRSSLDQASNDGIEMRLGYRGNLRCFAPKNLLVIHSLT